MSNNTPDESGPPIGGNRGRDSGGGAGGGGGGGRYYAGGGGAGGGGTGTGGNGPGGSSDPVIADNGPGNGDPPPGDQPPDNPLSRPFGGPLIFFSQDFPPDFAPGDTIPTGSGNGNRDLPARQNVPEPSTIMMFASAILAMAFLRRRRNPQDGALRAPAARDRRV